MATFDATTVYSQWTTFPTRFDPVSAGMSLVASPVGDLDADDKLTVDDINTLADKLREGYAAWWLRPAAFDVNGDNFLSSEDHRVWVKDLKHTWFGDANFDGQFNSRDLVAVFTVNQESKGDP